MSSYYLPYAIQCAEIAARMEACEVRERMKRGVGSLALISSTAAFFGLLGMVVGMMNSFRSIGGSASFGLYLVSIGISRAMTPGILGLAVALVAFWSYRYLCGRLQVLELEMRTETIDLVNRLVVHVARLRATTPEVGNALSARPSSSPMTPVYSDEVLAAGPRFRLPRMHRHGLLELIWTSDRELVLDGSSRVCFAYGVIGFLAYWLMNRSLSGLMLLGFFGYAGWLIKRDPKAGVLAVFAYFAAALGTLALSPYGLDWGALVFALAPLLILGSWRGVAAKRTGVLGRVGLVFLLAGACTAASFGTIFGLYETEMDNDSMSPEIRAGDWLIGVISSPESRVYPGELVEVHNDGWLTAARVVGLDGDGRVEVDGGFFVVYGRPYSRTPSPVPRQYIAARLIAVWSPVRRSVVVLQ